MTRHEAWAKAIQKHEGYFPGSRSFRNNNPGNFRCAQWLMNEFKALRCEDNFIVFGSFEDGWKALLGFLRYAATDKLRSYRSTMTLYEFFSVYAPSADKNNPKAYAEDVARQIGISPFTKIKELLIGEADIHIPVKEVPDEPTKIKYTIQKGDTLYQIAVRFLGSGRRWVEIAKLNSIANPKKLRVGQSIEIPKK